MSLKGIFFVALAASQHIPFALAQISASELIDTLPKCAITPVVEAATSSGCEMTDIACMCTSQDFMKQVEVGVMAACPMKDALQLKNNTMTACGAPIRNRSHDYITLSIVMGTVTAVFVIQRFALKLWARLPLGADDWLTLATLLAGIPSTVNNVHGVGANGLGRDIWTLRPEQIYNFGRFFYALSIVYFLLVALLKLAMLFFYLRIFPSRGVRRLLWATVAVDILFGASFILVSVFQCWPINYFWLKWDGEHEGHCLDIDWIAWANATVSIVLDIWMLAVPLWQLRSLNLDWKKKVGVGVMFILGTFVTIVSGLRLRSLILFDSDDTNPTWNYVEVSIWSTIEINVGIICVCLPTVRLLLVKLFPRFFATVRSAYYTGYGPGAAGSGSKRRTGAPGWPIPDEPSTAGLARPVSLGKGPALRLRELSSSSASSSSRNNDVSISGGEEDNRLASRAVGRQEGGIMCNKMFTIEITEADEERLVTPRRASEKGNAI